MSYTAAEFVEIEITPQRNEFFKYIIYVMRNSNSLIVEDCSTGRIAMSDVWSLNKYIKNLKPGVYNDLMFQHLDRLMIFDIELDDDNNYMVTNVREFLLLSLMDYVTITIFLGIEVKDTPETDKFSFDPENGILKCTVPFLPMFVWNEYDTFTKLMFYYNNEFYRFPYGNVNASGSICSPGNSALLPQKFLTMLKSTVFNLDYGLGIRNYSIDPESLVDFDIETILNRIDRDEQIHVLNIFYLLSELDVTKIPWEKILLRVPLSWFGDSEEIKRECVKLARSLLPETKEE